MPKHKPLFADMLVAGMPIVQLSTTGDNAQDVELDRDSLFTGVEIIDFTNVTNYYFDNDPQKFGARELFNVMPPFDKVWMETDNEQVPLYDCTTKPVKSGVLILKEAIPISEIASGRQDIYFGDVKGYDHVFGLSAYAFQWYDGDRANAAYTLFLGTGSIIIDPMGKPLTGVFGEEDRSTARSTEISRARGQCVALEIFPALLAFQFLHCKNVNIDENIPHKSYSKRHFNQYKRPLLTYKTLAIEPMKRVLELEGGIKQNGLKKALHICRGHFATYKPSKPLFGHFVGTIWKEAHVRGDAKHGIVAKDYAVKAPK